MAVMFSNCSSLFIHKNVKKVMSNHNKATFSFVLHLFALCIKYYDHTLSGEPSITTRLKTRSK